MGSSPYFLSYGFQPLSPSDFLRGSVQQEGKSYSTELKQAAEFLENIQMHRESARLAITKAQHDQAKQYNRGRRAVPELKKGSKILINPHSLEWAESKGNGAKLSQRWIGPFEVMQQINPKVFCLRMSNKYPGLPIFNVDHFKKYVESLEEFRERSVLPETRMKKAEKEEFTVEKILKHKYEKKGKIIKYLVQWEGYGPQFDSWEPKAHLTNALRILSEYRKVHNL
jgi:hypothetical protein